MAEHKQNVDVFDVIIIGAGLCGISCGAGLKTFGMESFVILEKGDCCGYFWKTCTYDRLTLHTPYHDLPHDAGLVYKYPKYKSPLEVVSYLTEYSDLYGLSSKIRFNSNVIHINKISDDESNPLWHITYTNYIKPDEASITISSKYLVIATSLFRSASIPNNLYKTMNNFNGVIMHSIEYKNASQYKDKNILVVGNGNSACEICIDAAEYGVNKISLVSRRPRHFIPLKSYEKGPFKYMLYAKYIGQWDKIHSKMFKLTKKHRKWKDAIENGQKQWGNMSVDLSKYGIIKPELSNTEETVEGNYEVIDIGFIPLLKSGRIDIIKGGVESFDGDKIYMENGEILQDKYDVVILCTGFKHDLEKLFDKNIFNKYFYDGDKDKCELYKRYGIFPKTNGFNQALNDKSLYFACFDVPITGGLARGLWGWEIARMIAKNEDKYNKSMELSHWNYMNTLTVSGIGIVTVGVIGTVGTALWYLWKNKPYCFRSTLKL